MARSGVDGATSWLAGTVRVLQEEVRELRGLLRHHEMMAESRPPKRAKYIVEYHEEMMDGMQLAPQAHSDERFVEHHTAHAPVVEYMRPESAVSHFAPSQVMQYAFSTPGVGYIAPAASLRYSCARGGVHHTS